MNKETLGFKVGDELIYSECGNKGRVKVCGIARENHPGSDKKSNWGWAIALVALEELNGSRMFKPISKGEEWTSSKADEGGHHAGWFLRTEDGRILL